MKDKLYEDLLKKIIRETFQSEDMIEYLCQNLNLLRKREIVNIVRKAFIPIERKLEFFEELTSFEDREGLEPELERARECNDIFEEEWIKKYSYFYQASALKEALKQVNLKGEKIEIFYLIEYLTSNGTDEEVGGMPMFFSYEDVELYLKLHMPEERKEETDESLHWYVVEKYTGIEDDTFSLKYSYYVFDGKIMYYDNEKSDVDCDIGDKDLNIPVPFAPGDIVVCDGKPTCEKIRAVILRTGDNIDCCSLVGLCKRKDGTFESVPVKHSNMFYESDSMIMVPPLYSMKRVSQQIRDEEPEMVKISEFIRGDEDRGFIVEDNVCASMPVTDVNDIFVDKLELEYQIFYDKYRNIKKEKEE